MLSTQLDRSTATTRPSTTAQPSSNDPSSTSTSAPDVINTTAATSTSIGNDDDGSSELTLEPTEEALESTPEMEESGSGSGSGEGLFEAATQEDSGVLGMLSTVDPQGEESGSGSGDELITDQPATTEEAVTMEESGFQRLGYTTRVGCTALNRYSSISQCKRCNA